MSDAAASAAPGTGPGGDGGAGGVPTTPQALNAWLATGEYKAWPHESAPHASAGPHGGTVQTYVNDTLLASLAAKAAAHPEGAAAVKELITAGTLSGWAVLVKTRAASDQGKGFYWYEVFDTKPGANAIEGQGLGTCTGCHASGADYVLTPYPLQ